MVVAMTATSSSVKSPPANSHAGTSSIDDGITLEARRSRGSRKNPRGSDDSGVGARGRRALSPSPSAPCAARCFKASMDGFAQKLGSLSLKYASYTNANSSRKLLALSLQHQTRSALFRMPLCAGAYQKPWQVRM